MSDQKNLPASRITQGEAQAFFDGMHADYIMQGQTRVEILNLTRDPSDESIDFRTRQVHRGPMMSGGTEMGWMQLGRGEYGQIVLLESSSDWDED